MYLAKIEEYFFKYRRQGTILSPQNWLIAERWEQMGIPIHIVCKGIKKSCREFRSTHKEGEERIDMLTYCEPEIFKLWKDYRKNLLGVSKHDKKNEMPLNNEQQALIDMIRIRLENIRQDLQNETQGAEPWGNLKAMALAQLHWADALDMIEKEFCKEDDIDIDAIEKRLSDFEKDYLQALFRLLSEDQRSDWTKEIEEELSSYKEQMEKDCYEQTIELGIESLMRERLSVRRISLYAT
jgi:hypothetical protein